MKRRKGWLIGFFVLVALAIAVAVSVNGRNPIRVRLIHPVHDRVEDLVTANSVGSVEPEKTAVVASEIAGRVQAIRVRQGEVKGGQVVFEIDSRDLEAEREVTRREIETARARIEQAAVARKKVWEDLERLKRVDVPKGDVERTERDLEIARKLEEIAQLEIRRLEAQLDVLNLRLTKTMVAAPFAGTVVRLHSEEGESVTPGKPLFTIHSAGDLLIRAPIDEVDMGRIALDLPARATFDTYGDQPFPGRVIEITPAASTDQKNNRTVDVKVRLDRMPPSILSGMSANIEVVIRGKSGVLSLPSHLVRDDREGRGKVVWVAEGDVARARLVKTGISNWKTTEITHGLSPEDRVIVPLQFVDERPVKEGSRIVPHGK